jgi:hypothetical protein
MFHLPLNLASSIAEFGRYESIGNKTIKAKPPGIDAIAITEASRRPKVSFIPVKSLQQQDH